MLRQLSQATDASERLSVELPALYRLVDSMLANRIASDERLLHDQGELDKLTRKELAEKKAVIQTTARKELAARLTEVARDADEPLASWFRIERVWLDTQLGQNLVEAEAECWPMIVKTRNRASRSVMSAVIPSLKNC